MTNPQRILVGIILLALTGVFASAFLFGGPSSLVSWQAIRAVAIESDDWGLAGFIPSPDALEGLDLTKLGPGNFPKVYWGSTLEDSAMVADLATILRGCVGSDGLPAVLQPNYVLGSLAWEGHGTNRRWKYYVWPDFPAAYARPGLHQAVAEAMAQGVWYPEFHAMYHYETAKRMAAVATYETSALAARRDVLLFRGSEQAWELAPGRSIQELGEELDHALNIFQKAFGRPVGAVIAPDYTWDQNIENLWLSRGVRVFQAKREQRFPARGWGWGPRIRKVLQQCWEKTIHHDRVYLERNCRLEPVQSLAPDKVAPRCVREVHEAWQKGQPAIIEAHRINFVHTEPDVVQVGQRSLASLLDVLVEDREALPMFLVDSEIASLYRNGTSVRRTPGKLVLRNMSWSGRLVDVGNDASPGKIVFVPARSVVIHEL